MTTLIVRHIFVVLLAGLTVVQAKTTLHGRLLGADGKPMAAARVGLGVDDESGPSATPDSNGNYTLTFERTGLINIVFSGVGHATDTSPLLVRSDGQDIELNARLGRLEYGGSFDSLFVVGDFNDWDWATGLQMARGHDGRYTVTLTFPKSVKTTRYQLVGLVDRHSVNGTEGIRFEYDNGGDWRSVVAVRKGKAIITFDPSRLVAGQVEPEMTCNDPFQREVGALITRLREHRTAIAAEKDDSGSPVDIPARITTAIEAMRSASSDIRPLRALELLALVIWSDTAGSRMAVREALATIGPASVIWELSPTVLPGAITATDATGDYRGYIDTFFTGPVSANNRAIVGYILLYDARARHDSNAVAHYYSYFDGPLMETSYGEIVKSEFDPARAIQVGHMVPDFTVASLSDPHVTYTRESMKGKIYMIDFWATWCGPCVAEMPNLHRAYERFHPRGFEILSLSFDQSVAAIPPFRTSKWAMPWLHTFVTNGFRNELSKRFEVMGIPKPILVDEDGMIIATEESLRGDELIATLSRVYNDSEQRVNE